MWFHAFLKPKLVLKFINSYSNKFRKMLPSLSVELSQIFDAWCSYSPFQSQALMNVIYCRPLLPLHIWRPPKLQLYKFGWSATPVLNIFTLCSSIFESQDIICIALAIFCHKQPAALDHLRGYITNLLSSQFVGISESSFTPYQSLRQLQAI